MAYRDRQEIHYKNQKPEHVPRVLKYSYVSSSQQTQAVAKQEGFEHADSLALAELINEAYPHLAKPGSQTATNNPYKRKLRTLQERFHDRRKWQIMQQRLFPGILALVPIGGDYNLQNHE